MVAFDNNIAFQGGGVWTNNDIKLIFKGNSTAFFYNNLAEILPMLLVNSMQFLSLLLTITAEVVSENIVPPY